MEVQGSGFEHKRLETWEMAQERERGVMTTRSTRGLRRERWRRPNRWYRWWTWLQYNLIQLAQLFKRERERVGSQCPTFLRALLLSFYMDLVWLLCTAVCKETTHQGWCQLRIWTWDGGVCMAHDSGACVLWGDRGVYESINSMFPLAFHLALQQE